MYFSDMKNIRNILVLIALALVGAWAASRYPPQVDAETLLLENEKNTIAIFEKASPSVVFITNKGLRRDFFTLNIFEIPQGSGTGFLWDDQGHIVTNYHVIHNADALTVTLGDQSAFEAKVIGIEPNKDLAVLKIDLAGEKYRPVDIGASSQLRVGQKVLAIGNPFGLDQTLSVGVISALGREIESLTNRTIHNVIQIDAAINPGNSGGPLLDSKGTLIGMNTAIMSPDGSSIGIGFAVPVNTIKRVVPQLIQYGKVIKPGLGIHAVNAALARRWGISEGVMISKTQKNSTAESAGLRGLQQTRMGRIIPGDVILKVDNQKVANFDALSYLLEGYKIGDEVTVTYRRNNKVSQVSIKLQQID